MTPALRNQQTVKTVLLLAYNFCAAKSFSNCTDFSAENCGPIHYKLFGAHPADDTGHSRGIFFADVTIKSTTGSDVTVSLKEINRVFHEALEKSGKRVRRVEHNADGTYRLVQPQIFYDSKWVPFSHGTFEIWAADGVCKLFEYTGASSEPEVIKLFDGSSVKDVDVIVTHHTGRIDHYKKYWRILNSVNCKK